MKIKYHIIIKSNNWPRRIRKIDKIIKMIFRKKNMFKFKKNINYYFNFVLSNDKFIKKYNNTFKKINKSTDVLSFSSELKISYGTLNKYCDIIVSSETLNADSIKNKINFYDHFTHIIVHSLLHINGYSHSNKKKFLIMKNLEIKILKNLGVANPYY